VKTGLKVVVAGGGDVGCEVAAFLAENGKEVTIVEMRDTDFSDTDGLAPDMDPILRRWFLFELWPTLPIEVIGKSTFREVTDEGLIVEDREGRRRLVAGDTIIFAAGMKPNNNLKKALQGKVPELYEVGDCVKPRHIRDAVEEAARVARLI
jgi:2,4-dienoyl-CoA reductase (NADPH2)